MPAQPYREPTDEQPDLVELDPTEIDGEVEPGEEEIDYKVRKAQEKLLLLRQQQEFIERQKRELEEISRRQDELDQNRATLRDLIGRSIIQIEREVFESEQRIETMRQSREILAGHLVRIDSIDPKSWDPSNIRAMISRSIAEVEAARSDYERVRAKLSALFSTPSTLPEKCEPKPGFEGGFLPTFQRGLAFTLPLLILGSILAALLVAILTRLPNPAP